MAAIGVILGGMLGFVIALGGLVFFNLSALQALSLWSGTGVLALTTLCLLAPSPRPNRLARA